MGVSILTLAVLNAEIPLTDPVPFIECFRFAPNIFPQKNAMGGTSLSFPRRLAAKKSCHELNHLQGITELFEARNSPQICGNWMVGIGGNSLKYVYIYS